MRRSPDLVFIPFVWKIEKKKDYLCSRDRFKIKMGTVIRKVINVKEQQITTNEGKKLIRRVTTVQMPNGRYRYPVHYYDPTPGPVLITKEERDSRRIHVYQPII